jgi:predicted phosphodiesterase
MRFAILADIHANLAAFTAVLDDLRQRGFDELWCLGDVVGYGPEPHQCIELLRQYQPRCVAGNHDWAAIGKIDTAAFNTDAAAACAWTARQLEPEDIAYLEQLPALIETDEFTLVHGSPREPIREYLVSPGVAGENLPLLHTRYCLVGHSHRPLVFECDESGACSGRKLLAGETVVLGENRLIINPGGVGQPRDGDPRAAYAIYDSDTRGVELHRISYDIPLTQARMTEYGLPLRLINRLGLGL